MKNLILTLIMLPLISYGQESDIIANELMVSAEIKIEDGNYTAAIIDLTKALDINPNLHKAYYLRGYASGQIENPNHYKVLSDLNKFLKNSTEFSKELIGYVYYLSGIANNNIGDVNTALNDLESSINYYPDFAASYRYRAGINFFKFWNLDYRYKKKLYKLARKGKSSTGGPLNPLYELNLMLGYDIISDCQKSLELQPDSAYAYYIMGRFKERLSISLYDEPKWNIPRDWGCSDLKQGAILGNEDSKRWFEESSCF